MRLIREAMFRVFERRWARFKYNHYMVALPSVDEPSVDEPSVALPSVDEPSVDDPGFKNRGLNSSNLI